MHEAWCPIRVLLSTHWYRLWALSQKSHNTLKHLLFDRWPKIYEIPTSRVRMPKCYTNRATMCNPCAATSVHFCLQQQAYRLAADSNRGLWSNWAQAVTTWYYTARKTSQHKYLMSQTYGSTIDNAACTYGARMERITFILCSLFVCLPRLHGVGWQSDSRTTPIFKGFSSHWRDVSSFCQDLTKRSSLKTATFAIVAIPNANMIECR